MITVGTDAKLKTCAGAVQVSERAGRVGQALCAAACPDHPLAVAVGGDNKQNCIELADLSSSDEVMNRFGSRPQVTVSAENTEAMES
ncbi:unnamed protein product [Colias eurytheme]|nr:unnamed protein product [Colias eurytheme]